MSIYILDSMQCECYIVERYGVPRHKVVGLVLLWAKKQPPIILFHFLDQ